MCLRCLSVTAMVCLGSVMAGRSALSDAGTCRAETAASPVVREDAAAEKRSAPDGSKLALLVGCTHYEGAASKLRGPANDVKLMQRVLAGRFGFQAADMDRLVGWPDDVSRRPTYANIVKAFERLVKKAGPNSQIVILLSGHGSQVPVPKSQTSLLDPANREIDGMDEVFLPSDCKSWENDTIPNSISDNQIAAWLERMKVKGASVWLICDCCHSGTLSKSGGPPAHGIRWRKLDPHTQLGIPQEVLRAARKRAEALGGSKGVARLESPVTIDVKKPGKGHVVAFFAAQPFERAPEMPRPRGADRSDPTKVHGLLTYTLVRALEQNRFSMTYRELSQKILAAYRAENMISLPTPFCDGDVGQEVLGLGAWPDRSRIVLERHGGKLFATSGELQGLVNGSILRVHPPAGSDAKEKRLGYVKVVKAGVALSEVKPCAFKEKDKTFSAVEEKTLPNLGQ
ncbi:MAG: caspase family protein, partial [Planctomycetes bacterium]|nr:caspase family protein [Planctomycetota bacterium]